MWAPRHRGLVALVWLQVLALFVFAGYQGYSTVHSLEACVLPATAGAIALCRQLSRSMRSAGVAGGLVLACSVLVYLSHGAIEAHFSYFVAVAFLTLYQQWAPFLIAIVFVLFEHGIVGVLDPTAVYDHSGMSGMDLDPWKWAFIHAGFVLAASFANLLAWRLTEHEALHDPLTGLPNRVLFLESVRAACHSRSKLRSALLFIDLDNFKDANDGYGHETGNELLQVIAARLLAVARYGDVVGRLGGDEFGVLIRNVDDEGHGLPATRRYLGVFAEPFALRALAVSASASIGLVFIDDDVSTTPMGLLRNADLAMYDAKRAGGARISTYLPDMGDAVVHRATLQAELRQAVTRGEFVVHYQPLVSVQSGEFTGNEALVRWEHPTRGLVPPGDFIGTVEESDLIGPLGKWVLQTACEQTVAWQTEHPDQRPLTISVNLSPRQLADPELVDNVLEVLADTGLSPEHLCLEITENAVIKDFNSALPKLRALKAIGISLALDDFGTGYSSLSYLRLLPVDSVKIDRSFITELPAERDQRLVRAIIDLAHALGMSVTAEGVETRAQLDALKAMAANVAQGYLTGRPVPAEQITERLARQEVLTHW